MIIKKHSLTKIKYKSIKYYIVVLIAFCISLTFHVEMTDNADFARHQMILNAIRNSKVGFWDYVLNGQLIVSRNQTFAWTFCFNALCYIIAKLFKNNYVMVWVSSLIDYGLIAYIAYDWKKDSKYKYTQVIYAIMFCYALYPMIRAFDGIRTSLAASFMALAVYLFLYRDCSIVKFVILCFISVTIHPVMLFAIPIAVVIKVSPKILTIAVTIIGTLLLSNIAMIMRKSSSPFFRVLAAKYFSYTSEHQFRAYRFCFYGVILICILCIVCYLFLYRRKGEERNREIKNADKLYAFLICYMSLILGNIGGYELVMRPSYLLGALSPIVISFLTECKTVDPIRKLLKTVIILSVFGLTLYMSIMYIYYFMGRYFTLVR